MLNFLERFEKIITFALILLLVVVLLAAVADLAWTLIQDLLSPPVLLLGVDELLNIFGWFLLVLVGIELLDTIKAYLVEHVVHEEVIVTAAMVAVLRKVIILDIKKLDSLTLIGLAVIIAAVTAAYWIVKRTHAHKAHDTKE